MSLETRIEKLENPNLDGRRFGVTGLAEAIAEARRLDRERIHIPWSERELPDPEQYTHPRDRGTASQMRRARLRMRRLEAEGR